MTQRRFRYLREPLFLLAALMYVVVRAVVWEAGQPLGWVPGQQTDVLLLPVGMPVWLWIERQLGWRGHDGAPTVAEVGFLLVTWSVAAEVVAPVLVRGPVGVPHDVAAYLLGALACLACWGDW